jgi:tetratricopeptide (TPR) repeat protein
MPDVMGHFEKAKSWAPFVPQYRALAGAILDRQARAAEDPAERRDLFEQAVDWYDDTPEMQPGYSGWLMAVGKQLGEVAAAGGDATFDEAIMYLDDARRLAPLDWRIPVNKGDVLIGWARTETDRSARPGLLCRALDQFETAIKLRPRTSEAWNGKGRTLAQLGHLDDAIKALKKAARFDRIKPSTTNEQLIDAVENLQQQSKPPPVVDCPA